MLVWEVVTLRGCEYLSSGCCVGWCRSAGRDGAAALSGGVFWHQWRISVFGTAIQLVTFCSCYIWTRFPRSLRNVISGISKRRFGIYQVSWSPLLINFVLGIFLLFWEMKHVKLQVWCFYLECYPDIFYSRQGLGIFLFTTASRMALRPTQPPIQWVPEALSQEIKRAGHEADHSPPSSSEVKEWVELYLHSPIRFHGVVLS
jgi:hypothetical protein